MVKKTTGIGLVAAGVSIILLGGYLLFKNKDEKTISESINDVEIDGLPIILNPDVNGNVALNIPFINNSVNDLDVNLLITNVNNGQIYHDEIHAVFGNAIGIFLNIGRDELGEKIIPYNSIITIEFLVENKIVDRLTFSPAGLLSPDGILALG
ncbi:MAG: hypothetical protein Q7R52_02980 [archaeon]|nr:hypothetical protein [archaeon]